MDSKFLQSLLIDNVATEADDITKEVNTIMGGNNAPAEKVTNDNREEDLTKVDGIFNDINEDTNEDNPQDNPVNEEREEDLTDTDNNGTDAEETDTNSQEKFPESQSDNPITGEDGNSSAEKSVFSDKNTLKKNMIYFHNIIKSTIVSLESVVSTLDKPELLMVLNKIIKNLYSANDILYQLITVELESKSYEELMTKYITIKRVYDISSDMLEEFLKANPQVQRKVKVKRFRVTESKKS